MRFLKNPVILAQHLVREIVEPGARAIDATAGNGHDTVFLASLVENEGEVFAFDTQPLAIHRTAERLKQAGIGTRVSLINAGHEKMKDYVHGSFQAVMFNLGYLPGARRQFATQPETTVPALQQAAELLTLGGILTVVIYVGHPGAREEERAVAEWAASLPQNKWDVIRCDYPNRINDPPYLLAVQRVEL